MQSYRVLIAGGFSSDEDSVGTQAITAPPSDQDSRLQLLRDLSQTCDFTIANIQRDFVHHERQSLATRALEAFSPRSTPERKTAKALSWAGVNAALLANHATLNRGPKHLQTLTDELSAVGVSSFGANVSRNHASEPFTIGLPSAVGGGHIQLHGLIQEASHQNEYSPEYVVDPSVHVTTISRKAVPSARADATEHDTLHIALPHWAASPQRQGDSPFALSHRLLTKEYDLVLGHGGNASQEISRTRQRWVVHNLAYSATACVAPNSASEHCVELPAIEFWPILEVNQENHHRRITLKIYPIYADVSSPSSPRGTVTSEHFHALRDSLASCTTRPWRFANDAQSYGEDEMGHYLTLELGAWEIGKQPSRLVGPTPDGDPADWPLRSPSIELEDQVLSLNRHLGAAVMSLAAEKMGGSTTWLNERIAVVECQAKRVLLRGYDADESPVSAIIVKDKVLTAELLENAGVPTPYTVKVGSAKAAVRAAAKIQGPVVIKPANGNKSKGVSTDLTEPDDIRNAYKYARKYGSRVIVQEFIKGSEELRVMASADTAVAVNGRALPHVIGDGTSTIEQLIRDKNAQRTLNPSLVGRPIPTDSLTLRQLERLGMTLSTIPSLGEQVTVRNVAGLSVGGDTIQALDETSSFVKKAAVQAISAIPGLQWGGVDIMLDERTGKPYVLEINTQSAYGAALFPAYGQPLDIGSAAWNLRMETAYTEPSGFPSENIQHHNSPQPISTSASNEVSIAQLIQEYLRDNNWAVEEKGNLLLQLSSKCPGDHWITKNGQSQHDRGIARHVVKNHKLVLRLLNLRNVPHPRSRTLNSTQDLKKFIGVKTPAVFFEPAKDFTWVGPDSQSLSAEQVNSLDALTEPMFVQSRLEGTRVRVIASNATAYAVTSREPTRVTEPSMSKALQISIDAIRAIPELRWAAVDVVIREERLIKGQNNAVMVEGMTLVPKFSHEDWIIAGSIKSFIDFIVNSASN